MLVLRRRWARPGVLVGVLVGVLSLGSLASPAAQGAPATRLGIDAVVGADRVVDLTVRCGGAQRCRGIAKVAVAGAGARTTSYAVAAGRSAHVTVRLTAKQHRAVQAKKPVAVVTLVDKDRGRVARKSVRLRPAAAALRVTSSKLTVGSEHVAVVAVHCRATSVCVGSAALRVAGRTGVLEKVRVKPGARATISFGLNATQAAALMSAAGAWLPARVRVAERQPKRVGATTTVSLRMEHEHDGGEHDDHDPTQSRAYASSWSPTKYDTCTAAEHNSYAAVGVDGKLYPAWHPPVHTRVDGSTCTFGHEHGDDPTNSDLYEWAQEQFRTENPAARGLPFGYGSERMSEYLDAQGSGVHRHEDDPGHKVIVSNDQPMGVSFTDRYGDTAELTCDHLIKAHQGSHSSDATKNNTHELFYAVSCNDGTRLLTFVMTNYGNSNELHASCTRPLTAGDPASTAIETIGSKLPDGEGGKRLIPTADCIQQYVTNGAESGTGTIDDRRGSPASATNDWWWAGYEQWQSYTRIEAADGREIARFEPWFGVQNPSRFYVGNGATDTVVGYLNDLAWQPGNQQGWAPWSQQRQQSATAIDRKDPQAWFNGSVRDAWLTTTKVANAQAATSVVYTDPWGKNAGPKPFTGSVRTHISRTDNTPYVTSTTPSVTSRSTRTFEGLRRNGTSVPQSYGFFYDYGSDAQGRSLGVHAPN